MSNMFDDLTLLVQSGEFSNAQSESELSTLIDEKIESLMGKIEHAPTDALKEKFFFQVENLTIKKDDIIAAYQRGEFEKIAVDSSVTAEEPELLSAVEGELLAVEEAERITAEQEAERIAAERAAEEESERIAAERAAEEEAERIAAERAAEEEAERIAAERAAEEEAERIAAERAAEEEAERIAAERAAEEEAERIAAERAAEEEAKRIAVERAAEEEAKRLTIESAIAQEAELQAVDDTESRELEASHANPVSETAVKVAPGYFNTGETLANRFIIEAFLGEGGMGTVYQALDKERDERLALKVMNASLLDTPQAKERFINEAKISSQLSHPNIVNVFDVHQHKGGHFITMELLEGQSLRTYLDNLKLGHQQENLSSALNIIGAISEALIYAHEITVHRDIKPENIWLCEDGSIKLMDFGVARLLKGTKLTRTGSAVGSVCYMSPEQIRGQADIGHLSDQYSLASVLYEILVGEAPVGRFEAIAKIRKDLPREFSKVLDKALSVKTEDRYDSIAEFNEVVQKYHSGSAGAASGEISKIIKNLSIAAALILVVGGGYWLMTPSDVIEIASTEPTTAVEIAEQNPETEAKVPESTVIPMNVIRSGLQAQQTWGVMAESYNVDSAKAQDLARQLKATDELVSSLGVDAAIAKTQAVISEYEDLVVELKSVLLVRNQVTKDKDAISRHWRDENKQLADKNLITAEESFNKGSFAEALGIYQQASSGYQESFKRLNIQKSRLKKVARTAQSARKAFDDFPAKGVLDASASKVAEQAFDSAKTSTDIGKSITQYRKATKAYQLLMSSIKTSLDKLAPNFVVIKAGTFTMGDLSNGLIASIGGLTTNVTGAVLGDKAGGTTKNIFEGTRSLFNSSLPVRNVSVAAFSISAYEVSLSQFNSFRREMSRDILSINGKQEGQIPAVGVRWSEAKEYAQWLSNKTGMNFSLPSDAQWEYAARSGSQTTYSWGDKSACDKANYFNRKCGHSVKTLTVVGSFEANAFGLYDMHGNAAEWTLDCWHKNYKDAPVDGSAWQDTGFGADCNYRAVRGGNWMEGGQAMKVASRKKVKADKSKANIGFRLVRID